MSDCVVPIQMSLLLKGVTASYFHPSLIFESDEGTYPSGSLMWPHHAAQLW